MIKIIESEVNFVERYNGIAIHSADNRYFADIPVYDRFSNPKFGTKRFSSDSLNGIKKIIDRENANYKKAVYDPDFD